jgi:hypothetical protein
MEFTKMKFFSARQDNRSDIVVTLFALFALLLAGGISIATITTDKEVKSSTKIDLGLEDPINKVEMAARAGIDAARGHIQCHGITESGGLPSQYYVNGARFEVVWDKIDLTDSTVHVISTGFINHDNGQVYTSKLESVLKVDLMVSHEVPILHEYYKKNGYDFLIKAEGN